jgi:hypothetical protein
VSGCSFCGLVATDTRADEGDFYSVCGGCAKAWDANPGFLQPEGRWVRFWARVRAHTINDLHILRKVRDAKRTGAPNDQHR